jgi:hypothetical protein
MANGEDSIGKLSDCKNDLTRGESSGGSSKYELEGVGFLFSVFSNSGLNEKLS